MNRLAGIRRYIRDYKFNSLFIKNMLLLLVLILVPLSGTAILTYYTYSNMERNDAEEYSNDVTQNAYLEIEKVFKEAEKELAYIGFNSNVELFMYDAIEMGQMNYRLANIEELIRFPVISKDYIQDVFIYSFRNEHIVSSQGIVPYDGFIDKEKIEVYLKNQEKNKEISISLSMKNGYPEQQISIMKEVKSGAATNGIAGMSLDIDELKKIFPKPESELIYVTNGENIIFSNDKDVIGGKMSEVQGVEARIKNATYMGKDFAISSQDFDMLPFEIIVRVNLEGYQNQLKTMKNFMIVFLLLMGIITLGLSTFISIRLFRPIETIVSAIRDNRNVLLGDEVLFREKDELEYIVHSIMRTANLKRDVDEELSHRVKLLKKAQAVALQSQINPHFLNNTLETINWTAIGLLGGENDISEMTSALSKMLRVALENTDSIIFIEQEVEHCQHYLKIQQKRYKDKMTIKWAIPLSVYRFKTIKIILQPIIENAIYHGIKRLTGKGLITIRGELENERVIIEVEDNGLGMTKKEVARLNKRFEGQIITESSHIGLNNVNQRIKLYFGEEYGVFVQSTEGVGTTVKIMFPQILE